MSARYPFWRTFVAAWAAVILAVTRAMPERGETAGDVLPWIGLTAAALGLAAWAFRVEARATVGPAGSDARRRRRLPPRKVASCLAAGVVVGVVLWLAIGQDAVNRVLPPILFGILMAATLAWRWWSVGDPGLRWRDVRKRRPSWRRDDTPARTDQFLAALGAPEDASAGMQGASGGSVTPGPAADERPGVGAAVGVCVVGIVLTLAAAVDAAAGPGDATRVANSLVGAVVLGVILAVVVHRRRTSP